MDRRKFLTSIGLLSGGTALYGFTDPNKVKKKVVASGVLSRSSAPSVLNFNAEATRHDTVLLTWDDIGASSYTVQRATASDFSDAVQIYNNTFTTFSSYGTDIGTYYYRIKADSGPWTNLTLVIAYEAETTAFINKVITENGSDPTNKPKAIDNLIKGMKRVGAFSKMKAVYPRYGTTFNSQKLNLIDPNTFALSTFGTLTRSLAEVDYNGASGYESTGLTPSVELDGDDVYTSVFIKENTTSISCDLGSRSGTLRFGIYTYAGSTGSRVYLTGDGTAQNNTSLPAVQKNTLGRFVGKRKSGNVKIIQGHQVNYQSKETGNTTLPSQPIFLGAINNLGSAATFSNRKQQVAMIGAWVSDFVDRELEALCNQYAIDIGLVTTPSFMEGGVFSTSGILRRDSVII